uniref:Uncharacterized protein n=1 Tax=Rhizophagus irregularis (strain DAOM 181602 / DAOM 197198 / MUCL 43194) TaxID=747089 RepID=U9T398_RHIID
MALDSNFLLIGCFDSTANFIFCKLGLGFSLGVVNLEELDLFFRTDLNLILTGPFFGKCEFGDYFLACGGNVMMTGTSTTLGPRLPTVSPVESAGVTWCVTCQKVKNQAPIGHQSDS